MKKEVIAFLAAMLLNLPVASQARSLLCPFTDHIKIKAPKAASIVYLHSGSNLHVEQQDSISFNVGCAAPDVKLSDYVYLDVGYDDDNKCILKIKDGPFERDPTIVNWYCQGTKVLRLMGIDHDRIFSYDYTITFTG